MALVTGPARDSAFGALSRPSGAFAMVAIDQRESLRTMLRQTSDTAASDLDIVAFKLAVLRRLSAYASAFLLDRDYALGPALAAGALRPGFGLIVAADRLIQEPGGPVDRTELDGSVFELAVAAGATALKLLVPWDPAGGASHRTELVAEFVDRCRAAGVLSLVEGVVRLHPGADEAWLGTEGILEAARELVRHDPDLYKAQVPTLGNGSSDDIVAWSRRMTAIVGRPWVVLSSGVPPREFPRAVEAACRGGASGFLAGRAIWTGALPESQRVDQLEGVAAPLLVRLGAIVDKHARPWRLAIGASSAVG